MSKITFKCKGKLADGSPCDKTVSAKIHTGVPETLKKVNEVITDDSGETIKKDSDSIPNIPSDWEFTLICSRGHEDDYTYEESEK